MRTELTCCCATLLIATTLHGQEIPNGGFENWTDQGAYSDPAGWLTSNMVSWSVANMLTCEQGSPGTEGAFFVKVTDRLLTGAGMQQASITVGSWGSFPAFPYTQRPDALNGFWQYHPVNGGHDGVVNATLTRWNTETGEREYIANAPIHATSEINEWQAFSSPFLYYSEATPDSAIVSIQATSTAAGDGTSVWVDELSFGSLLGMDEADNPHHLALWPDPVCDELDIAADDEIAEVLVLDAFGRGSYRTHRRFGEQVTNVADLAPGIYLLQVHFNDGRSATRRFIKQ